MTAMTSSFHTLQTVFLTAQAADSETISKQLPINADLGLIGLGLVLLGLGSFVFIARLCKTLTSGGND